MEADMAEEEGEKRFEAYMEQLGRALWHADRQKPLKEYCTGLLTMEGRKSVEPMAAEIAPAGTRAKHQALLHFVTESPWSEDALLTQVRHEVLPLMEARAPIEAWIIDDTGIPKKGKHSVGVARQYCGQLGKQDNCQCAVSLSIANHEASLPIAVQLYLPKDWAGDAARRKKAGVPENISFATKPALALKQIRTALAQGIPPGIVLMDAGYGADTSLREGVTALGLTYAAGILPQTTVWANGQEPLPPAPAKKGRGGRKGTHLRRDGEHKPVAVKALAQSLPASAWETITWREGSNEDLSGRFARLRVRPAHRDNLLSEPRPEEWLVIEWPEGQKEPEKYWFSTLPADMPFKKLIDTVKMRWRIEWDYRELKQEIGFGDFEGRKWRGFHHHTALCIAAYGFLVKERLAFPPSGNLASTKPEKSSLSSRHKSRLSAAPHSTTRSRLNSLSPTTNSCLPSSLSPSMSSLR
jgi:SRSO17 transposase